CWPRLRRRQRGPLRQGRLHHLTIGDSAVPSAVNPPIAPGARNRTAPSARRGTHGMVRERKCAGRGGHPPHSSPRPHPRIEDYPFRPQKYCLLGGALEIAKVYFRDGIQTSPQTLRKCGGCVCVALRSENEVPQTVDSFCP